MAKDAETTVRTFDYDGNNGFEASPQPPTASTAVLDVSYALSKVNHRLYRQGRQYAVKVDAREDSFYGTENIQVWALMPTWYLKSAWRMAKRAYDQAMSDELAVLNPENVAKWRDFRVGCGIGANGVDLLMNGGQRPFSWAPGASLSPSLDMVRTEFSVGEYNLSSAKNLDNGEITYWHLGSTLPAPALGDAKFGIFEEYEKSRNESPSPETVIAEMPYEALQAEGEDVDYQEVQANGNEPPYNADTFPHACWVLVGTLSKDAPQRMSTGYFTAPLGMVLTRSDSYTEPGVLNLKPLSVEVKEGTYHGVHAPTM